MRRDDSSSAPRRGRAADRDRATEPASGGQTLAAGRQFADRFAALQPRLAHDLCSPLAVIQSYAGLLATGQPGSLNERQREFLAGILDQVTELTHRVRGMLLLAGLQTGTLTVQPQRQDLAACLATVLADARQGARARGQDLRLTVTEPDLAVAVDPEICRRMLTHFVSLILGCGGPLGGEVICTAETDGVTIVGAVDCPVAEDSLDLLVTTALAAIAGGRCDLCESAPAGPCYRLRLPRAGG
ncbi:MAG: histidine kinase dimerization/phospho-acceptor domain-containing protein [Candidatus Krumholzibacteria bacterium]|nr:histidine kinase dimerization/phospho-acceptor domain-containing protein [Candidatus Krumholzibacteria bacterium]